MPRFTVIPPGGDPPAQFIASDSAQVLGIVDRMGWTTAEVTRDGAYLFSVRLNENGVWTISRREDPSPLQIMPVPCGSTG